MYAKSNFYEKPLIETNRCTHLSTYSNDAVKVQTCKDQANEPDCLLNGNFYTRSTDSNICGGTAYRILATTPSVTGASSVANGQDLCEAACTSEGTDCDFFAFNADGGTDAANFVCALYKGTCSHESSGAQTGDIVGAKTRHCYFTTQPSSPLHDNYACKNDGDLGSLADIDMSAGTYVDKFISCHYECQEVASNGC